MPSRVTKKEALGGLTSKEVRIWRDAVSKDSAYIDSIRGEYTEKYPKKWIAVYNQRVFGPADSAGDILTLLKNEAIDPEKVTFAYLDPEHGRMLLL